MAGKGIKSNIGIGPKYRANWDRIFNNKKEPEEIRKNKFMLCPICANKIGSFILCKSCEHNKALIDRLKKEKL